MPTVAAVSILTVVNGTLVYVTVQARAFRP